MAVFRFAFPGDSRIEEYRLRSAGMIYSPDVLRHFAGGEPGAIEVEDRLDEVSVPTLVLAGPLGSHLRSRGVGGDHRTGSRTPSCWSSRPAGT